jgi:hypothetical protein
MFQEALVHAKRLPEAERDRTALDVAIRLADSLWRLGRNQETVDLLLQEQEYLARVQEPSLAASYYRALGRAYS